VCARAVEILRCLSDDSTVVHGELCPQNVLVARGVVCPVDWESAAWGAGEVDLAALTDGWPEDVVRACASAYQQARWPDGPPPGFERRLAAARLHNEFRWLGSRPGWTSYPRARARFQALQSAAERAGLLASSPVNP
jgi:aminoglycoside phosphotransferase (APT) family kinase protein